MRIHLVRSRKQMWQCHPNGLDCPPAFGCRRMVLGPSERRFPKGMELGRCVQTLFFKIALYKGNLHESRACYGCTGNCDLFRRATLLQAAGRRQYDDRKEDEKKSGDRSVRFKMNHVLSPSLSCDASSQLTTNRSAKESVCSGEERL
jgi:hypothetical protein